MLLAACTAESSADVPVPHVGAGKSDVADQVEDLGVLEFDTERTGDFAEDLQFFGYQLNVREGAQVRLDVPHAGTSSKLDTTMFVYGPHDGGGFGTSAIAFDDDSGWGPHSRLSGLELQAGHYLVVLGTHDGQGRGHYRLLTSCENGECGPVPMLACDEVVADNILACLDAQLANNAADPEATPLAPADALLRCSDAEALGPIYEHVCGSADAPTFCADGFDAFVHGMGPACAEALAPYAVECVFGDRYRDLFDSPDLVIWREQVLTSRAGLTALEREQVVLAAQSSAVGEVASVEEAFARADEGQINQVHLWDRTSARGYVVYEFGAGDTSVGAYFEHDTDTRVAIISDGAVQRCTAAIGDQLD